jgi:phosphate transport system substrate-binding protein
MRQSLSLLLSFLPIFVLSCNSIDLEQRHLVVSGSSSFAPLMRDIADRFQAQHPGVRVDVSTSADGVVGETREGLVDVALLGREVRSADGLRGVEVARDGLAFIVHPSNPLSAPEERQLVGMLTRAYTDWSAVGGSGGRVVVVGVAEGRASRTALLRRFQLESANVPLDVSLNRDGEVVEVVAKNPQALGYVSLATALEGRQSVRLLPLGGVSPTLENLRNGRYPYVRPLVLASRVQPDELALAFLEFAQSPEVHDLLQKHGFAPTTQP